jgi:hypothetical protein
MSPGPGSAARASAGAPRVTARPAWVAAPAVTASATGVVGAEGLLADLAGDSDDQRVTAAELGPRVIRWRS